MFRALFFAIVFVTLAVNLILLFATKDKPPDGQPGGSPPTASTFDSVINQVDFSSWQPAQRPPPRRLFLRSNDLYDLHEGEVSLSSSQLASSQPAGSSQGGAPTEPNTADSQADQIRPSAGSEPPLEVPEISGSSHSRQLSEAANNASGRRRAGSKNTLAIRVKSSKNHVLITVDNLIIYESGGGGGNGAAAPEANRDERANSARGRQVRRIGAPGRGWRVQALDKKDPNQAGGPHQAADNESDPDRQRGLHVLVLNQAEGFVMAKRCFDTYTPGQDEELALFLGQIQPGRLLVMAVQDEASFRMARSSRVRKLIASSLGSRHILQLDWRDMWAIVALKRPVDSLDSTNRTLGSTRSARSAELLKPLAEGLSKSRDFADWAPPVELEAEFQLVAPDQLAESCSFRQDSDESRARRRHFCNRIEGYGRVCDCSRPSAIEFAPRPLAHSQLVGVPIVVMASNRPYYLYRMLRSLLQADGIEPELITVFIDGFYEEPRALCELLGVRQVQTKPEATRSARISHHYKTSLAQTFDLLFPEAKLAIILEEDLDLARDALVYFNQTRRLLETDSSLYCVSAWNDQGYEHSAGDLRQLLRVETMPGLGWMLTRRLFEEELKAKWPSSRQQHDWDMWIRTPAVRRGRECIIPEVSRTFHFGSRGTNINGYFQQQYFSEHAFSDYKLRPGEVAGLEFGQLDQMQAEAYDATIELLLSADSGAQRRRWFTSAKVDPDNLFGNDTLAVVSNAALCALLSEHQATQTTTLARQTSEQSDAKTTLNVIFIKMIDANDFSNWLKLAKCWRLWDLDARGQHKSMWRLRLRDEPTLVIGHPASPFSKRKPRQVLAYELREPS